MDGCSDWRYLWKVMIPMNKNAMDIMMGAPGTVEQKQLDELHLAITAKPEE